MLDVSRSLLSKWVNYDKRPLKKMGRPPKFNDEHKKFLYESAEGKLTIINKVSSRNLSSKFEEEFGKKISFSYVNKLLLKKFGRPYRGINTVLLKEEHIRQRLVFSEYIIGEKIEAKDIIFTDECWVILFPRINPKINIIRFNEDDKKKFMVMK